MKQGSKVHKTLEEEVHRVVPVDVTTKEDAWGLKLWNVIQGLRTLRFTGMTRELEVWGLVDGQVINGVIDELSYNMPIGASVEQPITNNTKDTNDANPNPPQQTLEEYWAAKGFAKVESGLSELGQTQFNPARKIYLTDVKTRGSRFLPKGSSLRPTIMQLMLYRKLLVDLASNNIQAPSIFARYQLKQDEPFSDSLIAQIGRLDFNFHEDSSESDLAPFGSQEDSVSELLRSNSLTKLWQLMIQEFQSTIKGVNDVGDTLRAEFRSQADGTLIGSKVFEYDEATLSDYVQQEMSWWSGKRDARGVDVEEAFKCRMCDFADECSWRLAKIGDAAHKYRKSTSIYSPKTEANPMVVEKAA